MSTQTKAKKPSRRKAGNSPIPSGPVCGHSGCGGNCNVRYAGATTHVRDHYIHQAAQGVKHVWMAAVVAGFAVVVTGSIAYTAAQAETAPRVKNLNEAVTAIYRKLDRIETLIKNGQGGQMNGGSATSPRMMQNNGGQQGDKPQGQKPPELSTEAKACVTACQTEWKSCQESAGDSKDAKEACSKTGVECLKKCLPSGAPVPPLMPPPPKNQEGGQGQQQPPTTSGEQAVQ
jgi:hypothetical protein